MAKIAQFQQLAQLGLDMVSPIDLMKSGRTPYAKNFRLYAQQTDDRQVAVSSRKGSGYYTNELLGTAAIEIVSSTGASTVSVNSTTSILMKKFTAIQDGRLYEIEVKIGNPDGASGPVLIEVWDDDNGKPGVKLSSSSLLAIPTVADYVSARFINPPLITYNSVYWIVVGCQDDCVGEYKVSTTTIGNELYVTNASLQNGIAQDCDMNCKINSTDVDPFLNGHRMVRDNGDNITVVADNDGRLYSVDEVYHDYTEIMYGLSTSATDYSFAHADNKLFFVNGYDDLMTWDGSFESDSSNMCTNGGFETNITGWTAYSGLGTVSQSNTYAHTGTYSLKNTAASGNRTVQYNVNFYKHNRYHVYYWVYSPSATTITTMTLTGTTTTSINTKAVSANTWTFVNFYFYPTSDQTALLIQNTADIYIDDVTIKDSHIDYIVDSELPILSQICYHKDRLWGVSTVDPNKIHFSNAPGNPVYQQDNVTPETSNNQWYNAWRSVDFVYVPRPHEGSPVTALESFQDSLFAFTQDGKYVISGYDSGSFVQRESTGFQGAMSRRGVAKDENNIYFVGTDGFYSFDGTYDTKLSTPIDPLFDAVGNKTLISPVIWKNKVRFYMPSLGSSVNDTCAIWNKDIKEWEYDTDTFVSTAIPYDDANDDNQLVEISSLIPIMYLAEKEYNNLGAPIDFEYRLNYNALGSPAQKKRIKKFFPILQGVDNTFPVTIAIDRDFQNSPRYKSVMLSVNGAVFGTEHELGDGILFGGQTSFKMNKLRLSGYGLYWQFRILRKAVNNRVAFVGAQFSYKTKRI